ncbi:ANTAR domain-containing protein [Lentzea sp.]|uniref:ANTAR domain-containing protein n=1 Tax=Lentzea sp. TaxID=56099 RepID=UPI002ED06B5F
MDVTAARTEAALVLTVPGADVLDATAIHALSEAAATTPPPSLVVLDLRGLTFLNAVNVRNLLSFATAQAARGVRSVLLVEPAGAVSRVLETADPDGALPRFAGLEDALLGTLPATDVGVDDLVPEFEVLTRSLLTTTTVAGALRQVVNAARHLVPAAAVVSVTLRAPDGTYTTPAETDHVATALDVVQYRTGRGPCLQAARLDGPGYAVSPDLGTEQRWPEFAAAAVEHGLTGVLSTELLSPTNKVVSGALNIYTRHHDTITDTDRHTALLLATHASLALAHLRSAEVADLQGTQMRQAIGTRDIIGQAKGILMNRQGITADQAFALLRETSQQLNVKLVEVATTLVARHGELGPRV